MSEFLNSRKQERATEQEQLREKLMGDKSGPNAETIGREWAAPMTSLLGQVKPKP